MSDIRGLILHSRFDYLENKLDSQASKKLLEKLSPPARQVIEEQIFPVNKYPFHILKELDNALPQIIASPLERLFKEIGLHFAEVVMDRYFFNYIESHDPRNFLAQIKNLYFYLWDFGEYTLKKNENNQATITISYDEDIHKPYCWFMQAFIHKGLESCGAKEVTLIEATCEAESNNACIYELEWAQ